MLRKPAVLLCVALSTMLLTGCGGSAVESGRPLPAGAAPLVLPAPSQLPQRGSSFTVAEGAADGADYDPLKPHNRVSTAANDGVYAPALGSSGQSPTGLAYAVYDLHLPNYTNQQVDLDLTWGDAPTAGTAYVALADFAADRWRWMAVPAANKFTFPTIAAYRNPGDHLFLAVAVSGTDAAILTFIQFKMQEAPVAQLVSDKDSGPAPLAVSFDASSSSDDDGTLTDYEWDFDGDGAFNEAGAEQTARGSATPAAVTYSTVGSFNAAVRVTDNDSLTDIAERQINVAAGVPPVAALTGTPATTGPKPLLVDFDATASNDADGSIADYEWDFDGDNNFNEAGDEAAARGDATPPTVTYSAVGSLNAQVRVTDNDNNSDVAQLAIDVTNTPPVANLQAQNGNGPAPLQASFDASLSSDAGGTIVDYEWDFDGNGMYNDLGAELTARGNPTPAAYTYTVPGNYTVSLRLTDDDAATSTATFDVHAHGWKIVTADTPSAQGGYAVNLLLQNGNPVILHTTLSGYGVRLVRSTTAVGDSAADWTGATVLDGTHAPTHASFALIGGNPACTFFADNVPNGLFYSRSTTASGMSSADWLAPVQLDVSDLPGLGSSLLEVNGKPAVAYGANSTGDLRYAYSSTSDGASGWTSLTVDGDGAGGKSVGSFMSLAIVSGCPAIVYSSQTAPIGLLYIKSTTAGGTALADWTGGTHTTINTDSSQNGYPSLLLVGGFPATPFIDSAGTLRYARSTSATGGAAWTLSTVDSAGEYLSMAIIGGKPAVAYHNATTDRARYVSSSTADGNGDAAWTNEADVTTSGSNGRFAALTALASGQPAMAYRDDGNGVLKYGVLY